VSTIARCRPVDITGLPLPDQVPPPLIDDTLARCAECDRQVWAGPTQLFLANLGQVLLWCYFCAIEVGRAQIALGRADNVVGSVLNPLRVEHPRI
jgi:hypothetical protein